MFGFDLLTVVIIGATLITVFVFWISYILADSDSGGAILSVFVSGALLLVEVIYLIVRFVKFVWFL